MCAMRISPLPCAVASGEASAWDDACSALLIDNVVFVETLGPVRVPADRGEHGLVRLGRGDGLGARRLVDADREHPPHPDPRRVGDQERVVGLAEPEMAVGVDHSGTGFGGPGPTSIGPPAIGAP